MIERILDMIVFVLLKSLQKFTDGIVLMKTNIYVSYYKNKYEGYRERKI